MSLWLVSYVALWLLALLLVGSTILLFRQLGLLHLRFGPRGAIPMDEGLPVDTAAPVVESTDIRGATHLIGGPGSATTLVFVSPGCSICEYLVPAIRALYRTLPLEARLLVVTNSDNGAAASYARQLGAVPVIADPKVAELYDVVDTPFALHLNREGVIVRKGMVNTLEQLESVVEDAGLELIDFEGQISSNSRNEVRSHDHA